MSRIPMRNRRAVLTLGARWHPREKTFRTGKPLIWTICWKIQPWVDVDEDDSEAGWEWNREAVSEGKYDRRVNKAVVVIFHCNSNCVKYS